MINKFSKIIFFCALIIIIAAGLFLFFENKNTATNSAPIPAAKNIVASDTPLAAADPQKIIPAPAAPKKLIAEPIADALARISKKPFGIYVRPGHSPVSPERFTGYHTGVDFETYASETDAVVPVYAICTGTLAIKEMARGYGGMAVQRCKISGQDVTVVYGHIKLASVVTKVGDKLSAGEQLAILGKGYSTETAGERKHLHLGIHKGTVINTSGYVSTAAQLSGWIDVEQLLK
jgi:murein DD-endopeptidase MepM/ murein hydrolase activator NlpD